MPDAKRLPAQPSACCQVQDCLASAQGASRGLQTIPHHPTLELVMRYIMITMYVGVFDLTLSK